jgi:YYY domain-containing protein
MAVDNSGSSLTKRPARKFPIYEFLFLIVLVLGAYLRFNGIDWGEYSFMHPDERFLLHVGSSIRPVSSLSEFFDTARSSLNPHNVGHNFYVYGTLPMFLARYVVEWVHGQSGFIEMTDVGRPLSALADLLTLVLVYATAGRLYGKRVAVLAAAFLAFAVLHIQQSHFFTMDTFITAFTFLAIYFAVRVVTDSPGWKASPDEKQGATVYLPVDQEEPEIEEVQADEEGVRLHSFALFADPESSLGAQIRTFMAHPLFILSVGFGIALGMAVASKLSAAPVAFMLPAAAGIYLLTIPAQERQAVAIRVFGYLVLAAVVSVVVFRIFQPYAFSGPGFFGILPNEAWVRNIQEQRIQAAGDVDFPPAMQWARRPIWFSAQNMVLFGMGLPFGLLAWGGFLWMGWRILQGQWRSHLLLWGWIAFYFIWQSLQFNPTMRYQLPVYPALAIVAGWTIVELAKLKRPSQNTGRIMAALIGAPVLIATLAWAFAFSGIYTRPFTRVDASYWIYQNIPGPINLHVETNAGVDNHIVAFPYNHHIQPDFPYFTSFTARNNGIINEIFLPEVVDEAGRTPADLTLILSEQPYGEEPWAYVTLSVVPEQANTFFFEEPVFLYQEQDYYLSLRAMDSQSRLEVCGSISITLQSGFELEDYSIEARENCSLDFYTEFTTAFSPDEDGFLVEVTLNYVERIDPDPGLKTLQVHLLEPGNPQPLGSASVASLFSGDESGGYLLRLDRPFAVEQNRRYEIRVSVVEGQGSLVLWGSPIANEGDWDDGLPLRLLTYDGFGGIYQPGLNFNMYWDDNPEKLERFLRIMNDSEYIVISSSRQWASLPRIPERFPLVTTYYRNLLACPDEVSIEWCYRVAQPGDFQGNLGFELVEVFQSDPVIGPFRINTQFAEEAFTVYDHPKVFIFRKAQDYDPEKTEAILGTVDFSKVIRLTPKSAASHPADLMLPTERLIEQRQGGAWSELFSTEAPHNRFQSLGVLVWYLSLALLGLVAYPWVRLALPGLNDRGYPLARMAGLLLLTYMVWAASSMRLAFSQVSITVFFLLMLVVGIVLAYLQRHALLRELRERGWYFLAIEGLFLAFFVFGLLLRFGNPDLWHPFKGGEKPMDFAYFNAILKSTSFPPYDPWYAGGYLNYYYYGFVLVAVLTKWLGIVPAFAYNLFMPTIFMLIAMGAFSVAWNLVAHKDKAGSDHRSHRLKWVAGFASALGMVVLGNLGTVQMILVGYQRLGSPTGIVDGADLFMRFIWTFQGLLQALAGAALPYGRADWYWIPSRTIPAQGDIEPITEFPFFTVLYADPHAHLFALPVALLALAFAVSVVLSRARWQSITAAVGGLVLGGLAIGALYPINLSDIYSYLPLGIVAIGYSAWRYYDPHRAAWLPGFPAVSRRLIVTLGGMAVLVGLALIFYQPYSTWYGQGYSSVELWTGPRTPSGSYLVHWGLFLFVLVSWMAWETREWMANTPLSALRKLEPYKSLIQILAILLLLLVVGMLVFGIHIAWIVLPLAVWAGLLLLRPDMSETRRLVLFLVGTGLLITLMVEVVRVQGDIGRMNTVFKFYLQAWTLFAVSAAAALVWLVSDFHRWSPRWRTAWQLPFILLVASAFLYTLVGGMAKIQDRMVPTAPRSLDGMEYMQHATYNNLGTLLDLNQDYHAIRWMQENVNGSPVIVEGASPNQYHWFSRFSIYTGLPSVVGWEWHQIQQRVLVPGDRVRTRVSEVGAFYRTADPNFAAEFLTKYDVQFIIVGQLERGYYEGVGLDKFDEYEGALWKEVYRDREMVIYETLP